MIYTEDLCFHDFQSLKWAVSRRNVISSWVSVGSEGLQTWRCHRRGKTWSRPLRKLLWILLDIPHTADLTTSMGSPYRSEVLYGFTIQVACGLSQESSGRVCGLKALVPFLSPPDSTVGPHRLPSVDPRRQGQVFKLRGFPCQPSSGSCKSGVPS